MKCNYIENNIIAYIEKELSSKELTLFDEHISSCKNCKDLVSEIRKTYQISSNDKETEISNDFFNGIQQKIEHSATIVSFSFSPIVKKLLVAASISILIASSLLTGLLFTSVNSTAEDFVFNEFQNEPIEAFLLNE